MSADRQSQALDQVYAARNPDELKHAYAAWAAGYDAETAALGYLLPFQITAWVARHVPVGEGPLLDAGCGTGLSGPSLCALGYDAIEGLDMSAEMLAIAETRGVYRALKRGVLGEPLPWPDGYFRAVLSTGVFTEGHAPATALLELVRIVRSGGHLVFSVRDRVMEEGGFAAVFEELRPKWRLVEESPWYRAFAVAEPDVLVRTFVFAVV